MKPYQSIPIQELGESLVPIPGDLFLLESPHPYQALGAPYQQSRVDSPYYLRAGVLERLKQAQGLLNQDYPGWKILVFDAYRPVEVQQFMVDFYFQKTVEEKGYTCPLSPSQEGEILEIVYQFWALPSLNPLTPPPHSTGAALDITLVNSDHKVVDMGSPIDEISPRSSPNYFAESGEVQAQEYHRYRMILKDVMLKVGFQQHPQEWWHFCYGDQMWAWLNNQAEKTDRFRAFYGRY